MMQGGFLYGVGFLESALVRVFLMVLSLCFTINCCYAKLK